MDSWKINFCQFSYVWKEKARGIYEKKKLEEKEKLPNPNKHQSQIKLYIIAEKFPSWFRRVAILIQRKKKRNIFLKFSKTTTKPLRAYLDTPVIFIKAVPIIPWILVSVGAADALSCHSSTLWPDRRRLCLVDIQEGNLLFPWRTNWAPYDVTVLFPLFNCQH